MYFFDATHTSVNAIPAEPMPKVSLPGAKRLNTEAAPVTASAAAAAAVDLGRALPGNVPSEAAKQVQSHCCKLRNQGILQSLHACSLSFQRNRAHKLLAETHR